MKYHDCVFFKAKNGSNTLISLFLSTLLYLISQTAIAAPGCSCKHLLDISEGILEKCKTLNNNAAAQSKCLDRYNKAASNFEACQTKINNGQGADGSSTSPICTPRPKKLKPKIGLGDCGFTLYRSTDVPETINADTIDELLNEFNKSHGGIRTEGESAFNPEVDVSGKITNPKLGFRTGITSPRLGLNKTTPLDVNLMKKLETLSREHELKHLDIAKKAHKDAACAMIGKTYPEGIAIFNNLVCDTLPKAQQALESKEGKLVGVQDSTGKLIDIKLGPYNTRLQHYIPDYCTTP